jgi:hypothetical protein
MEKQNKGLCVKSVQSVCGRVELRRHRFGNKDQGSECPADQLVDQTEAAMSVGARQLCCREGSNARSFERGRENLRHLGKLRPAKKGSDQRYKQIYVTCLYDQSHERRLVGLVDGAVCLKANLDALPLEMVLLDFYHASEHVGDAATATGADKQWLEQTLHTLRHEGFDPFFQKLLDWRTPLRRLILSFRLQLGYVQAAKPIKSANTNSTVDSVSRSSNPKWVRALEGGAWGAARRETGRPAPSHIAGDGMARLRAEHGDRRICPWRGLAY